MTLPAQDPYWTGTADFIRQAIGPGTPFIGPRELRPFLPAVFEYEWVYGAESLRDCKGVAIHKGLMRQLPLPVLRELRNDWKCVFANAVFIFFMPSSSPLPAAGEEHLPVFYENLASLEKQAVEKPPRPDETTACVVVARHAGAGLKATLRSLSPLHVTVEVLEAGSNRTTGEALKTGVTRLLAEERNTWIATFDDSVVALPWFLAVMEKWRDPEQRPLLGGYWEEADGLSELHQRDGFFVIVPRRPNRRILYAHRDYWARRFGLWNGKQTRGPRGRWNWFSPAQKALVIPGLVVPRGEC